MVDTDEMEMMLAAILNGTPKDSLPFKMTAEHDRIWKGLEADCKKMPKGAVVEIGSEGSPHDFSNLYSTK